MQGARIRIWRMVGESYGFLRAHPGALLRVGGLPLLLLFGLNLAFGGFSPWPEGLDPTALLPHLGLLFANVLAQSLVAAAVLVTWHRVVLLGEDAVSGPLGIRLGFREVRYLGAWLLLSLMFLAVLVLVSVLFVTLGFGAMLGAKAALVSAGLAGGMSLGQEVQFIALQILSLIGALLIATYATTRLSLILPALATDRQRSFGGAWHLSDGNGWRLVAASLLVMLPIQVAHLAAARLTARFEGDLLYWPAAFLASGLTLLLIFATGTLLSLFSKSLEQDSLAEAAPARDAALVG
ncbi:MAG: hypothetical protein QNJ30_25400 [Kiloniellales bacterium]|nr:hypothetical protein [Kiloniellales bacterium]